MYRSLEKVCTEFHLYIFAFDKLSFEILTSLKLKSATIISLSEFEDEALLKVKPTRSAGEYCWTSTPSSIKFVLEKYNTEHCTYLDADLFFYEDPAILLEELTHKSVLITSHRYTPKYDKAVLSGKYCVQFMCFKNEKSSLDVLNWWRNACLDWCYARHEDGKFGDQKYLDDWTNRFSCVHELEHLGGGLAPWNVQQYSFTKTDSKLLGTEIANKKVFTPIFYHFHQLKIFENKQIDLCRYNLSLSAVNYLYQPYVKGLIKISEELENQYSSMKGKGVLKSNFSWKTPLVWIKTKLRKEHNIYKLPDFINGTLN